VLTIKLAFWTLLVNLVFFPFYTKCCTDTGQEEYSAMHETLIHSGQAFILLYSITSLASFDEMKGIYDKVFPSSFLPKTKSHSKNGKKILRVKDQIRVPMVLVGNQLDRNSERQVDTDEGWNWARERNIPFFEASAMMPLNITEIFEQAVREVHIVK